MKAENITNQDALKNFFKATREIIAENTSHSYSIVALVGIKKRLDREFKLSRNINIKGKSIKVNKVVNSISQKELRMFFAKIVSLIAPNYLRFLLTKKLSQKELNYLGALG